LTLDRYEEENLRLRQELEARGGPSIAGPTAGLPNHGGQPPQVGHGPNNLFGQIMTGGGGQGGPGLAPPPPEPAQPQGLGAHIQQGPPLTGNPGGPPGPPSFGYGGPSNGMRFR
jgi:glucose repression regulatory protein TUP1